MNVLQGMKNLLDYINNIILSHFDFGCQVTQSIFTFDPKSLRNYVREMRSEMENKKIKTTVKERKKKRKENERKGKRKEKKMKGKKRKEKERKGKKRKS
jgi:replication initiation and membrane attachment protein DnaB